MKNHSLTLLQSFGNQHAKYTNVPALVSDVTDGRMQRGGTGRRVRMRSQGAAPSHPITRNSISYNTHFPTVISHQYSNCYIC